MKVSVISGKAAHAVFFPIPNNDEVTSHPVNDWKKRRASERVGPSCWEMWWMGMSLKVFLTQIQSTALTSSVHENDKWKEPQHQCLLSLVCPCSAAWRRCSIIRVPASSWEQGDKAATWVVLLLSPRSSILVKRWYFLSFVLCTSCSLRNSNSSFLFSDSLRKFCQSAPFEIAIFAETLVRFPSHEFVTWCLYPRPHLLL